MIYVLSILLIVSCFLYIFMYSKTTIKKRFILKMITSSMFLILAYYVFLTSSNEHTKYEWFILSGLSLGFIGDAVLGARNISKNHKTLLFACGLLCFMLGHISYISSLHVFNFTYIIATSVISIILFIISIIITTKTNVDFGKTRYLSYFYILLSAIFLSSATMNLYENFSYTSIILLVGVASFCASDFMLSYLYFGENKNNLTLKRINIATYYLGQFILALSLII